MVGMRIEVQILFRIQALFRCNFLLLEASVNNFVVSGLKAKIGRVGLVLKHGDGFIGFAVG